MAVRSLAVVILTAKYHEPPATVRDIVTNAVVLSMYGIGERREVTCIS